MGFRKSKVWERWDLEFEGLEGALDGEALGWCARSVDFGFRSLDWKFRSMDFGA